MSTVDASPHRESPSQRITDTQGQILSTKTSENYFGGYLSGGLDFMKVSKINTNSIDFACRNIISADSYKSLIQYIVDFTRLIASAANSKFVELSIFDPEVIDLLCFVYPSLQKKIEPLSRFDRMICFRSDPMFEVREMPTLRNLHGALGEFYKKNGINYRWNTFFVPVVYDWMRKGSKLIGSVIIMDPSRNTDGILQTTKMEKVDSKPSKMIISSKSTKVVNSFANSFVCELQARYSDKEFRSLITLSKPTFIRQEPFTRN